MTLGFPAGCEWWAEQAAALFGGILCRQTSCGGMDPPQGAGKRTEMQDPFVESLDSGDRHFRKATTIKLGASSPRSNLWILLRASCSGAPKSELLLSGMTTWDSSSPKLTSMTSVPSLPAAASWLMLFLVRSERSEFLTAAQAQGRKWLVYNMLFWSVSLSCEGWAWSGDQNLSQGCSTSVVHAVPWKHSQRVLLFI